MKEKKEIVTNLIYTSIYQFSGILVPLVTMPYVSRILGAAALGEYSFAYSVAYYFTIFIKLGLNHYGNRTIAYVRDDKKNLSKTFWEIYVFQLFIGIVLFFIYLGYVLLFSPQKILGMIMALLILAACLDVSWCLYGLEKFKVTSVRDTVTKIIVTICIFCFVKSVDDLWKYALFFSVGTLLNQIVVIPVIMRNISFSRIDLHGVVKHIKPNIVLFIPVIAVSVYRTIDKIMLGIMSTDVELGFYHGAENVIRVPMVFVTALGTVMLPRMSNMLSNGIDSKNIQYMFTKSIEFAMAISSVTCLGIMTVANEFVPLFYGKGFEKCIYLFYIILPGSMFEAFANVIRTQYLIPRKKDKIYITSLLVGASIDILMNILLIPKLASIGASIGTVFAYIAVCVTQAACVYRELNIKDNIIVSLPYVFSGMAMFVLFRGYNPKVTNEILRLGIKIGVSGGFYLVVVSVILFLIKKSRLKSHDCRA